MLAFTVMLFAVAAWAITMSVRKTWALATGAVDIGKLPAAHDLIALFWLGSLTLASLYAGAATIVIPTI